MTPQHQSQTSSVLGLLRFTAEDEFLLDEPDTHLNPRWCVDYISYLKRFIASGTKQEETSHILLTTHNQLAIAELEKEQVQILRMQKQDGQRQIVACYPEMAPRGMGYAAIVTSDMFGIASSLDNPTQELLETQRAFAAKDRLTEDEQREPDGINAQLDRLGFRFFHPDDEFSRYLRLRNEALQVRFGMGEGTGMLGAIFFKAQNRIQDPAKLSRLVQMIDEQSWVGMDTDNKGDLYEGLLQKMQKTRRAALANTLPRAR